MSKWLKIDLYCLQQKCSPKNLVFGDISFMAIFAEFNKNKCIIISVVTVTYWLIYIAVVTVQYEIL